jgi:hypothetical protein
MALAGAAADYEATRASIHDEVYLVGEAVAGQRAILEERAGNGRQDAGDGMALFS